MSFHVGQKVVVVDDRFTEAQRAVLTCLLTKGDVHVVREVSDGHSADALLMDRRHEKAQIVYLLGIFNPAPADTRWHETGYSAERFRSLDELKTSISASLNQSTPVRVTTVVADKCNESPDLKPAV